jgi:hypothetical protein
MLTSVNANWGAKEAIWSSRLSRSAISTQSFSESGFSWISADREGDAKSKVASRKKMQGKAKEEF